MHGLFAPAPTTLLRSASSISPNPSSPLHPPQPCLELRVVSPPPSCSLKTMTAHGASASAPALMFGHGLALCSPFSASLGTNVRLSIPRIRFKSIWRILCLRGARRWGRRPGRSMWGQRLERDGGRWMLRGAGRGLQILLYLNAGSRELSGRNELRG